MTTALTISAMLIAILYLSYLVMTLNENKLYTSRRFILLWEKYKETVKENYRRKRLLMDISDHLYYGEDLKDTNTLEYYTHLWEDVQLSIKKEVK